MTDEEFIKKLRPYHAPALMYYAIRLVIYEQFQQHKVKKLVKGAPDWVLRFFVVESDFEADGEGPSLEPETIALIRKERLLRELPSIKSPE